MLSKSLRAITGISRTVAKRCERFVGQGLDRLLHREHAGRLARLLLVGSMLGNPLRNETLLLLMEIECTARSGRTNEH